MQSLYINGVEVQVEFVQNETAADRKTKVVDAINTLTGMHGVTASDNGTGVTLTSDGRNLSVWFDSSITNLKASNFGLGTGDEVAQVSRITMGGTTFANTDTATVVINGVSITSGASAGTSAADLATVLETAINSKLSTGEITNVTVTRSGSVIEIKSTVPGSGFTLTGASSNSGTTSVNLNTVIPNSTGTSNVTGVLHEDEKNNHCCNGVWHGSDDRQCAQVAQLAATHWCSSFHHRKLDGSQSSTFHGESGSRWFQSKRQLRCLGIP